MPNQHQPMFEFNAPMFTDFTSNLEDHDVDGFFFNSNNDPPKRSTRLSIKQEIVSPAACSSSSSSDMRKSLSMNNLSIKEEQKSPSEPTTKRRSPRSATRQNTGKKDDTDCRSRSRSCASARKTEVLNQNNHEDILNQAIEGLTVSAKKKKRPVVRKSVFGGISLDPEVPLTPKEHPMVTRLDISKTPKLVLRTRAVTKDGEPHTEERTAEEPSTSRNNKRKSILLLEPSCASDSAGSVEDTAVVQDKKLRLQSSSASSHVAASTSRSTVRFSDVKYEPKSVHPATEPQHPVSFTAKPEPGTSALFPGTRKRLQLTEPKTPQFRTARRSVMPMRRSVMLNNRVQAPQINVNDGVQTVRFQNILHSGVPSTSKLVKTEVKPFSFEERDRQMLQRKEEKIKQALEEERKKAEFHANPLPAYINVKKEIPIPSTRSTLLSRKSIFQKYEQNENENPAPVPFKAQPPTVLQKEPFIPKKPNRPFLEVPDFELKTEKRARDREQFENQMKQKEMQKDMDLRERELTRKQREEEEIARMRQEAVHKAQPIPKYQPPKIYPSLKPLTTPMSPKFSTRFTHRSNRP